MLEKECVYNLRNRNVQRMLWPVDHEQLRIDLRNEQLKIKKEFTQKYNFDFDTEQPLGGRYAWEQVDTESPISSPILINANEEGASTSSAGISSRSISVGKNVNKSTNKNIKRTKITQNDTTVKQKKRKIKTTTCTATSSASYYLPKRSKRLRSTSTSGGRTIPMRKR